MKCPYCGIHYLDDARECPICGKRSPVFGQKKASAHRHASRPDVPSTTCAHRDSTDRNVPRDTEQYPSIRPRTNRQPAAAPDRDDRQTAQRRRKAVIVVAVLVALLVVVPLAAGFCVELVDQITLTAQLGSVPETIEPPAPDDAPDSAAPDAASDASEAIERAAQPLFNAYYVSANSGLELELQGDDYTYELYLDGYSEHGDLYWWHDPLTDDYPDWLSPDEYIRFGMGLEWTGYEIEPAASDLSNTEDVSFFYVYVPCAHTDSSELILMPAFPNEIPPWFAGEEQILSPL